MKTIPTDPAAGFRWLAILLIILLLTLFQRHPALALPVLDSTSPVTAAALKVISFGADPKTGLDAQAIDTLVTYVLGSKPSKEAGLPQIRKATGAYYEYDTKIGFANFLQYSFSSQIPAVVTGPASLRYSQWSGLPGEAQKLPSLWKLVAPDGKPVIIRGVQHDGITPDQTTGVYYEYDLKRALILLNSKGHHVLISISKQINISDVGRKGFILGNDDDWNYYYSGEPGAAKAGLGWVKSYIYDYFSVAVYIESASSPSMVRAGVFQWIRAGWSGINFVQSEHVILGMKRFANNSKSILESPNLPALKQIVAAYQRLCALPQNELVEKYATLQQARLALAVTSGEIETSETKKQVSYMNTPKEQMIEALTLEYIKVALGKSSLLGKQIAVGVNTK